MAMKRISAVVPIEMLEPLERHLRSCGVPGVTVEHVKGYGEHPNYFRRDLMQDNARVILYADEADVDSIIAAIVAGGAEVGTQAGILAVEAVERLVSLRTGSDMTPPRGDSTSR